METTARPEQPTTVEMEFTLCFISSLIVSPLKEKGYTMPGFIGSINSVLYAALKLLTLPHPIASCPDSEGTSDRPTALPSSTDCSQKARALCGMEMPMYLGYGMVLLPELVAARAKSCKSSQAGCAAPGKLIADCSQWPGHSVCGQGEFTDVSLPPSQPEDVKSFERMQADLCVCGSEVLGGFRAFLGCFC